MYSRAMCEHDAVVLKASAEGGASYHDLPTEGGERIRLDRGLDRLMRAGYITFQFEGRQVVLTDAGRQALTKAFKHGWRGGRLTCAGDLYPANLRGLRQDRRMPDRWVHPVRNADWD